MDLSDFMLIAGVGVLTAAFRSLQHPIANKLAGLALLATSFLAGWLLTGNVWVGCVAAMLWFFLPWVELLTRVRRIALPASSDLKTQSAPSSDVFPELSALTREFEEAGFQRVEDAGWSNDAQRHFFRLLYNEETHMEAAVCLLQQGPVSVPYLSITTRHDNNVRISSLTYPFSQSLKSHPQQEIFTLPHETPPAELINAHLALLDERKDMLSLPKPLVPDSLADLMRSDLALQIDHNVGIGLLERSSGGSVHYSWRGLFFLWVQFLRDLVRL